jgi:hypothetical protein
MAVHKYRVYDLKKKDKTFNEKMALWVSKYYPLLFVGGVIAILVVMIMIHVQGRPDFLLPYGSV